ncbi:hypothetical protein DN069_09140 [Streptacidiphilus pinicola]|uniref:Ricin B lectin domain-containing protein n=1 Tax=Streptacidiphilus pinicola TaxID=2219663 RepID=A0A2X0IRR7_9ACTN|nr:hypothetical protein DN069_09140 [Streptacidiphilus pinicola]
MVRALATSCDAEHREVPAVHAVVIGTDRVRLYLSTADEQPPPDWESEQDGRIWHAPLRGLQSARVSDALPDAFPQLVSLGVSREGFVLLNLGRAGGIIALEGDARQVRLLAQDWTRELTSSPWSREVRLVRIGFKSSPADPEETVEARSLGDATSTLAGYDSAVLLLATPPGGRDREVLHRAAADPAGRWTVVVVGRMEQPRWRLVLGPDGMVDTGFLVHPVSRRLDLPLDAPELVFPDDDSDSDPDPDLAANPTSTAGGRGRLPRRGALLASSAAVVVAAVVAVLAATQLGSAPTTPVARASAAPGTTASHPAVPPVTQPTATSTGPAAPPPRPAGTLLKNPATGECLSAGAGTDGTPLALTACNGNANQRWQVASNGTIQSQGLCMDAAWGATTPGTMVQVARCSGNPAQLFSLRQGRIYSHQAGLCTAEVNGGTAIHLAPCTGPSTGFQEA